MYLWVAPSLPDTQYYYTHQSTKAVSSTRSHAHSHIAAERFPPGPRVAHFYGRRSASVLLLADAAGSGLEARGLPRGQVLARDCCVLHGQVYRLLCAVRHVPLLLGDTCVSSSI